MEFEDSLLVQIKEEVQEDIPDLVKIINYDMRQPSEHTKPPDIKQEDDGEMCENFREIGEDQFVDEKFDIVVDVKDIMNGNLASPVADATKTQMICLECGKLFPDRRSYKLHRCGEWPFKCDQCGRAYKNSTDLSDHMKVHTNG